MTDYDDLCRRLRAHYGYASVRSLVDPDCVEAADAIAALRKKVDFVEGLLKEQLERAEKAEADNAALRAENARLLQLVLSPGTIPFNWRELEADNAALRTAFIAFHKAMETVYMETSEEKITVAGSIIRTTAFKAAKAAINAAIAKDKP